MNLIADCGRLMRVATAFLALSALPAGAEGLLPFSSAAAGAPPAPWRVVGLPNAKKPLTRFDIVALDGQPVLRVRTDDSYANLTYDLPPGTVGGMLRWKWRVDEPLSHADLRTKNGDDVAVKVCALFDLPLENIRFLERSVLRIARRASGEYLPGATLCYVWDPKLAEGTELANAFSGRLHYQVLNSAATPLATWVTHSRDLRADFLRSFGTESTTVPPLLAIVVGADADNTHDASLAYVGDVVLVKQ